jgi:hypothetical protein
MEVRDGIYFSGRKPKRKIDFLTGLFITSPQGARRAGSQTSSLLLMAVMYAVDFRGVMANTTQNTNNSEHEWYRI